MDKTIVIDGRKVDFQANALTPRLYRHKFGRDIVKDLNKLSRSYKKAVEAISLPEPAKDAPAAEKAAYQAAIRDAQLDVADLETFENVAFICARQADPTIPGTVEDWLEDFSTFSIYEILPSILELWALNNQTTATSKKK